MRKIVLLLFITISFSQSLQAQSLTLDELIKIRNMDADGVHSYLSAKGWRFSDASEGDYDSYSISTWSFGQAAYSDRAKAFVKLFTKEGYFNKVGYMTVNKLHYDNIKAKVLSYKMKKESSTVQDGYISSAYEGNNYKVELSIGKDDFSNIAIYNVIVSKKSMNNHVDINNLIQNHDSNTDAEEHSESGISHSKLSPIKLSYYKDQVSPNISNLRISDIANDISFIDESTYTCNLVINPYVPDRTIKEITPNTYIHILSKLEDEDHDYYLAFVDGYFGYIKFEDLKSNQ